MLEVFHLPLVFDLFVCKRVVEKINAKNLLSNYCLGKYLFQLLFSSTQCGKIVITHTAYFTSPSCLLGRRRVAGDVVMWQQGPVWSRKAAALRKLRKLFYH